MTWWISETFKLLSDEDLKKPISPGRNHGVWILGHLVLSEVELSKYLGMGDFLYPENDILFGQRKKTGPVSSYPNVQELKNNGKQ